MTETATKSKLKKTYYYILCEVSHFSYKADSETKQFIKQVKEYLLDVINFQNKGQRMNDPIIGCSVFTFHGHHLSWNKDTWKRSAHILYQYYKAKSLIDKIKEYEKIFKVQIVHDYSTLLNYFYKCISSGTQINYGLAPGLTADFVLVPPDTLDNVLLEFKTLYE